MAQLLLAPGALALVNTMPGRVGAPAAPLARSAVSLQATAVAPEKNTFMNVFTRVPAGQDPDSFPYKRDDWRNNLKSIPFSVVLRRIAGHIMFNVVLAGLFCALRSVGVLKAAFPAVPHSLAGAFLGLLVTFRTNSAYARFWEARIIWGGIMNTCRVLATNSRVWLDPRNPRTARRFLDALHDYPIAVARQCRDQSFGPGEHPTDKCLEMQSCLSEVAEPSTVVSSGIALGDLQLAEVGRRVDMLVDATGALNRIIRTPLPLAYSRHTSRFVTMWCTTLPFAIGSSVGVVPTLFSVAMVSWLVLGIDSIGQLLEMPFSQPKDTGSGFDYGLPAEQLGDGVAAEVLRLGRKPEATEILSANQLSNMGTPK